MIAAHHTVWADRIFQPYLTWLCKRHFHAIHLLGDVPQIEPQLPLLLLVNHSTWWDGFFIYLLNKKVFRRRAYLMMLASQLRQYPFFKYIGAFSVDPASTTNVRASIRYAAEVLRQKKHPLPLLCIFPQGELLPWQQRPLVYKRGFDVILQHCREKVNLLPLAIHAEFLGQRLPEAFFLFGENQIAEAKTEVSRLAQIEEQLLQNLADRIQAGEQGAILLPGKFATPSA